MGFRFHLRPSFLYKGQGPVNYISTADDKHETWKKHKNWTKPNCIPKLENFGMLQKTVAVKCNVILFFCKQSWKFIVSIAISVFVIQTSD